MLETTLVTENTGDIWNLVWGEILKFKVTEEIFKVLDVLTVREIRCVKGCTEQAGDRFFCQSKKIERVLNWRHDFVREDHIRT